MNFSFNYVTDTCCVHCIVALDFAVPPKLFPLCDRTDVEIIEYGIRSFAVVVIRPFDFMSCQQMIKPKNLQQRIRFSSFRDPKIVTSLPKCKYLFLLSIFKSFQCWWTDLKVDAAMSFVPISFCDFTSVVFYLKLVNMRHTCIYKHRLSTCWCNLQPWLYKKTLK